MAQNIQDLVAVVGGFIIVTLLGLIGYFVAGWMKRHDSRADRTADLLAVHDSEIKVMKNDHSHIMQTMGAMAQTLKDHTDREEEFWKSQEDRHLELVLKLTRIEERHAVKG